MALATFIRSLISVDNGYQFSKCHQYISPITPLVSSLLMDSEPLIHYLWANRQIALRTQAHKGPFMTTHSQESILKPTLEPTIKHTLDPAPTSPKPISEPTRRRKSLTPADVSTYRILSILYIYIYIHTHSSLGIATLVWEAILRWPCPLGSREFIVRWLESKASL